MSALHASKDSPSRELVSVHVRKRGRVCVGGAAQPISSADTPTVGGMFTGRLESSGSWKSVEVDPRSRCTESGCADTRKSPRYVTCRTMCTSEEQTDDLFLVELFKKKSTRQFRGRCECDPVCDPVCSVLLPSWSRAPSQAHWGGVCPKKKQTSAVCEDLGVSF